MTAFNFSKEVDPLSGLMVQLERSPELLNDPAFSNDLDMAMTVAENAGETPDLIRARRILSHAERRLLSA